MTIQTVTLNPGTTELHILIGQPAEPPAPAFTPGAVVRDLIWTWHAVANMVDHAGATWISGVQRDGRQVIERIGAVRNPLPGYYPVNDHCTPGMRSHGDVIVSVATGHNNDGTLRLRRVVGGTTTYINQAVAPAGTTTYAQIVERDGALWCLSRAAIPGVSSSQNRRWDVYSLTDTIRHHAPVIDAPVQSYVAARDGGVLAWTHPRIIGPTQGHIHRFVWSPGDAVRSLTAMTPVYVPPAGRSARVVDVSADATVALVVEFDAASPWGNAEYVVLRGLDGAVVREPTGIAPGHDLWETYFLGGCLDPVGGVWLCHKTGDGYALSLLRDGVATRWIESAVPLARPLATARMVAVQELEGYTHFTRWTRCDVRTLVRG